MNGVSERDEANVGIVKSVMPNGSNERGEAGNVAKELNGRRCDAKW